MSDNEPFTRREAQALIESLRDLSSILRELRAEMATTYVRKDVYETERRALSTEVDRQGDWQLWAQRIVIGVVLVGLVSLVVASAGGVPQ